MRTWNGPLRRSVNNEDTYLVGQHLVPRRSMLSCPPSQCFCSAPVPPQGLPSSVPPFRASPPHGRSGGAQGGAALGGAPPRLPLGHCLRCSLPQMLAASDARCLGCSLPRVLTASDAHCLGCSGGSPPPKPMTPLPPAMQARVHALGAHGADSDRLAAGRAVVPIRAAPPPGEAAYPAPAHPEHPHRPLGCSLSIHGACPIQCRAGLH